MHGLAAVTLSLGVAKILTGRRYDLLHAWYALKSRTKGSIAFAIPTYRDNAGQRLNRNLRLS